MGNVTALTTTKFGAGWESREALLEENALLRQEIRVARKAAEITADLVVKQFEETERILHRFQVANAQRKAVLDSATQISIIATNTEGIITVFNKGAESMLGYEAEEIIGKQNPLIFQLDWELKIRSQQLSRKMGNPVEGIDLFFAYAASGVSEYQEWTYVHKTGLHFPVRMSINALRDPDGSIEGFLCIALDVSEKKRSEKALRESERKYRLLIRNLPNIVYRGYLDGTIDFFDDKIEALTGYSRKDFLSRKVTWFDLIHEDDLEMAKGIFIKALRNDHAYIREYRFKSKTGDIVWVEEGGARIIFGEDGEVEFVTGAFLDITERKLAEHALHESERNYRSLFDSGPNPIFVLDGQSLVILDANPSAEETYGYTKDELVGRPFSDIGPSRIEDLQDNIEAVSPNSGDRLRVCVITHKIQHFKKGKKPFYVRLTACPTHYHQRPAIIVAATDITEVIEKDAQLVQASKMTTLGQMSAGVAHELNQPLNAIKMGNEFLKMMVEKNRRVSQQELGTVAGEVSAQVDRASKIINLLREFGHKSDFDKELVDVNSPIKAVLGIIGQQLKLENIKLVLKLDDAIPQIWAQTDRLEQVFFNLLSNASDAIHKKREEAGALHTGRIQIRSYRQGPHVVVRVDDTGVGISEEIKEKVFEPFFTTKEVGKGMGLGLSIIYGIVREYGGRIEIDTNPAGGASFRQFFPIASAP